MTNQLAAETSLYLRQHANNPVDWHPWGAEALQAAKEQNKPIFLSVGYSACHWCHVMEHESFEDEGTAKILNEHFICIKVDREERPDVDSIYMQAVQLLNRGQGGWPMSVWLTPDTRPFYAGTYFPPDDRYGRPSFKRVLAALIQAWNDRRDEVTSSAADIARHLAQFGRPPAGSIPLDASLLQRAGQNLTRTIDPVYGGFGSAPKFPHAIELRMLLRHWHRFGDVQALQSVQHTLTRMARGGIYDHLGGGFARYSVDARWLVPHFEKMLYDNALLTMAYTEAFQATKNPLFQQVVMETVEFVRRELTAPTGGFYCTLDADSEGEEGKFYVWSLEEVREVLGTKLAATVEYVYGVTTEGNFEGHTILNRSGDDESDAKMLNRSVDDLRIELTEARRLLFERRAARVRPSRDEKILTAWNGLMIAAAARAGAVFDDRPAIELAASAARFVLDHLRPGNTRLLRSASADGTAKIGGYLEDYSALADGLLELYFATQDPRWLTEATATAESMLTHFEDRDHGGFFSTAHDHEELIVRLKEWHDGSTPSGNSMAAWVLVRLAHLLGRADFRTAADRTFQALRGVFEQSASAAAQALMALDFAIGPVQEVVVGGNETAVAKVIRAALAPFAPRRLVLTMSEASSPIDLPLLADKTVEGELTVFLCSDGTCHAPLADLKAAIGALSSEFIG